MDDDTFIEQSLKGNKWTETHLITLAKRVIDLLNCRDYTNTFFTQYVSSDVRTGFEGHTTVGISDFISNYRQDADVSPNFRVDIVNSSAIIDEKAGRATVLLSQDLSGFEEGTKRAGSILSSWKWERRSLEGGGDGIRQGQWVCLSCQMLFGTPEFLV